MAKFNSILLGKVTGSVGNVTTARVKGQGVAKAKITQTTVVNSDSQVTSKNKMTNIVMAFQFLAPFLSDAMAIRKPLESIYNAFVRLFKTAISDVIATTRPLAASLLVDSGIIGGNSIEISDIALAAGTATVTLNTGGLPWQATQFIKVIVWIPATGASEVKSAAITEAQWNAGSLTLAGFAVVGTAFGAYAYDNMNKKCSNILFV